MIINPHRFATTPATAFDGFGNVSRSFDGTSDYIEIDDSDDLSFGDGSNDSAFSISAWVKLDDITGSNKTVIGKIDGTSKEYLLFFNSANNEFRFALYDDSSNEWIRAKSSVTINTRQWYHVGCTYNGGKNASDVKMYIDGNLDTTNDSIGSYVAMENTSAPLTFGSYNNINYIDGNIADVRIYDTELSASDIADLYAGTDIQTNLVGHWLKDTVDLLDHAGNNDGTNYGSKFSFDNPSPAVEFGNVSRSFDGTSNYIDLPDLGLTSTSDITFSCWVKTNNTTPAQVPFALEKTVGSFRIEVYSGNLEGYLNDGSNRFIGSTAISTDTWYHATFVKNGTDYEFYLNGESKGTYSGGNPNNNNLIDAIGVRSLNAGFEYYWDGNIADVRIYDTDLSASDIADIYAGTHVTTNLVGHWLTNNDDVDDYAGTNDGTNYGSTYSYDNPNAEVEYGQASRDFDGSNDYVDLGDIDGSAWQGSNKKFSASLWIKPFTIGSNDAIFNKASASKNQYEWTITRIGDEMRFIWAGALNPTSYSIQQTTNSPLVAGEWMHFAFTYDGTQAVADRVKLYINGSQGTYAHTLVGTPSEIQNGTQPLCIGGEWVSNGSILADYNGNIADVRIYDTDLSATDVYELAKGVDQRTNLVGQWLTNSDDVDDKAGTNDGTNYGSTYSTDSPL